MAVKYLDLVDSSGSYVKFIPYSATNNVISSAIAGASDGDVFVLDKGSFNQTESIEIPDDVKNFGMIGQGPSLTKIKICTFLRKRRPTVRGPAAGTAR